MSRNKKPKSLKNTAILSACVLLVGLFLYFVFKGGFTSIKSYFSLSPSIQQLNGVYEPSAAQQLKNGSVVVLEDEISRALSVLDFDSEQKLREDVIRDKGLNAQLKQSFDDLEGIAIGKNGELYATTSFSRTSKGKQRPNREKILRLVFDDNGELHQQDAYIDFVKDLKKSGLFKTLKASNNGKAVDLKEINIEGLSFDAAKQRLLFGFRKPVVNDLSMVLYLENPQQVLDGAEQPILSNEVTLLDLHGGGIRSLNYDDKLKGYLIANEVNFGGGPKQSQLWFWGGEKQQPISLILPQITEMKNIEAISAVSVDGERKILFMSDDGSRKNKRPAHYSLIDYTEIQAQISR